MHSSLSATSLLPPSRLVEHHGKGSEEKVRAEEEVECCGTLLPRHKDISLWNFIKIGFLEKELHKTGTVNIQLRLEEEFLRLLPSLPNCDKKRKKKASFVV